MNGLSVATRLLGCSYLSPWVIPSPSVRTIPLTPEDEFIVIGCGGLWRYVSYNQAVAETRKQPNPISAAKRLRDLARSYGSSANISVIVVRLNLDGIEVAPVDPRYRAPLSPPRKPRYRWSMIGLNTLTTGDSMSELSDAGSVSHLKAASAEWTTSRGSSAAELGAVRQTRTLPRREASFTRERQAALVRQAVFENESEWEDDEANETMTTDISNPFADTSAVHRAANPNRSSLTFVPNSTNPFARQTSLAFEVNGKGSDFQFTPFAMNADPYRGWSEAETELTATLEELKDLHQGSVIEEEIRPRAASVAVMQHNRIRQDETLTASGTNSTIHIPELDDLDRTLALIDQEFGDDD